MWGQGWYIQAQAPDWPGPVIKNLGPGQVNTNFGPGSINVNWWPGPGNTNLGPGPGNTNWGSGLGAKQRAGVAKYKYPQILLQWTFVLSNMIFNEFLAILNKISWSLHFLLWKLSYKTLVWRTPLLTNSLFYRTKILASFSNCIIDLANSIIFWSFKVYLQLLNHWNLWNYWCMQ